MTHPGLILPTLLLLITTSTAQFRVANEWSCSRGSAQFLCENLEECSRFISVDRRLREYCGRVNQAKDDQYKPVVEEEDVSSSPTLETVRYTSAGYLTTEGQMRTLPASTTQYQTETEKNIEPTFIPFDSDIAYHDDDSRPDGVSTRITTPPVNVTVAKGGTVQMSCSAEGNPSPGITLTKTENTYYPDTSRLQPKTSDKMSGNGVVQTMTNVNEDNEGWYTCQACNYYGCDRAEAYLRLLDLCALPENQCPEPKRCEADPYTSTTKCVCPQFCEMDELFNYLPSGGLCNNYCETQPNTCFMNRQACEKNIPDVRALYYKPCQREIEDPVFLKNDADTIRRETSNEREIFEFECPVDDNVHITEIQWYRNNERNSFAVGKMSGRIAVPVDTTAKFYCVPIKCNQQSMDFRHLVANVKVVPAPTTPPQTTPPPTTAVPPTLDNLETPQAPRSTCAVFGDPHFLTFDKSTFDYNGRCDNVLAMDCEKASWFVYGRMRACGENKEGSCLESATLIVTGDIVEIQRGWLVNVDGQKVVPKNHPNQEIRIAGKSSEFVLKFDGATLMMYVVVGKSQDARGNDMEERVVLYWDGYVSLTIQTPMSTRTCGMCGNNDGRSANDMRTRRNGMTSDPFVFGESWKIGRRCEVGVPAETARDVCGGRYSGVRRECEDLFNSGKLGLCGVDKEPYIEGCVYDECKGQFIPDLSPKCVVAQAYATVCGKGSWERGDDLPVSWDVQGWEGDVGCPTEEERFQPTLDTGCPQPTLEEELSGNYKWRI